MIRRMAVFVALAAALTLTTPGSAYAGTGALTHYWDGNGSIRAGATFDDFSETVDACDWADDGQSAVAQLEMWSAASGSYVEHRSAWADLGPGTCSRAFASLVEGHPLRLRACVGEAGPRTIIACGNWVNATA